MLVVSPPVVSGLAPLPVPGPGPLLGWADGQGAASGEGELGRVRVVQQLAHGADTAGQEGDEPVSVDVQICSLVNDDDVLDVAETRKVVEQILLAHLEGDAADVDPVLDDVVSGAAVV